MAKNEEAKKTTTAAYWVKIYASEWNQCVQVDELEWVGSSLKGWIRNQQVLSVNVDAVNAVFVTENKS